jgi:hypothetical protein
MARRPGLPQVAAEPIAERVFTSDHKVSFGRMVERRVPADSELAGLARATRAYLA